MFNPTLKSKDVVRTMHEESFFMQGGMLFNSQPLQIRNYGGSDTLGEGFKAVLRTYLNVVPDMPRDLSAEWYPNPLDANGHHSNSLVHWRMFLNQTNQEYEWT